MVAVWLAALALVGAPADSTYTCGAVLPSGRDGLALIDQRHVELGGLACSALLLAAMSPGERARTQHLNRDYLGYRIGRGLLIVLHEATHLSGTQGECRTEAKAWALLPGFLARYLPRRDQALALAAARSYDEALPASYHGC